MCVTSYKVENTIHSTCIHCISPEHIAGISLIYERDKITTFGHITYNSPNEVTAGQFLRLSESSAISTPSPLPATSSPTPYWPTARRLKPDRWRYLLCASDTTRKCKVHVVTENRKYLVEKPERKCFWDTPSTETLDILLLPICATKYHLSTQQQRDRIAQNKAVTHSLIAQRHVTKMSLS